MKTLLKISRNLFLVAFLMMTSKLYAQDAEKQKIIGIIQDELKSFSEKNKEKWASHWVHTSEVRRVFVSAGNYNVVKGWDSLSHRVKGYFESPEEGYKATKSDFEISIKGNAAIAHFTEKSTDVSFDETVILEKQGKDWKFVELYFISTPSFGSSDVAIEGNLNDQGYHLLARKKTEDAVKVFKLNTELFPSAFNTWDSLGEAYMILGDKPKAIEYYKKSLELNPKNDNAKKYLADLQK